MHSLTVVTGMRLYTGFDGTSRDPASYILEGRSSDSDPWEVIGEGDLDLPAGRNVDGAAAPDSGSYHQELIFENTNAYAEYRIQFPTNKGVSVYRTIGEIQLPGLLVAGS